MNAVETVGSYSQGSFLIGRILKNTYKNERVILFRMSSKPTFITSYVQHQQKNNSFKVLKESETLIRRAHNK